MNICFEKYTTVHFHLGEVALRPLAGKAVVSNDLHNLRRHTRRHKFLHFLHITSYSLSHKQGDSFVTDDLHNDTNTDGNSTLSMCYSCIYYVCMSHRELNMLLPP